MTGTFRSRSDDFPRAADEAAWAKASVRLGWGMDFIDIPGASGATYRFRRWAGLSAHPPIAGNFALVAGKSGRLVHLGVVDDLSRAPALLEARTPGADLFTRFNVARLHREAEHADMALQHPEIGGPAAEAIDQPGGPPASDAMIAL